MQQNNFYECLPEFELVPFLLILFLTFGWFVFFFSQERYVCIARIFADRTFCGAIPSFYMSTFYILQ